MIRWLGLIVIPLGLVFLVVLPFWIDQPFGTQTPRTLAAAYYMRAWSPWVTIIGTALTLWLGMGLWRGKRRLLTRIGVVVACLLAVGSTWFARQNPFEWMFNPLAASGYVTTSDASFVAPGDLVLAVSQNGDAAAYPILQLAYHHIVQDVVGGVPLVATY